MFPVQTSERAAAPHLRRDIGRSRAVARPRAWRAALLYGPRGRAPGPARTPRRGLPRALCVRLLRAPESCPGPCRLSFGWLPDLGPRLLGRRP